MGTPIKQHTLETYDVYSIIYGENNTKTKIPFNPNYLIGYLKNDSRQLSTYSGDKIKTISNYEYEAIGDLKFTLTIKVVDNEMSLNDFINNVLFKKYKYNNYESINKILSIAACTKSLLVCTIYILYYSDETNSEVNKLLFLNKVNTLQPEDLYNFVLNELNKHVLNSNPINIQDYIPTIEVEEMDTFKGASFPVTISNIVDIQQLEAFKNLNTISSTSVRLDSLTNKKYKEGDYTKYFGSKYDKKGAIKSYTSYTSGWALKLNSFPEHLLKYNKGVITNKSKIFTITIKKGFVIKGKGALHIFTYSKPAVQDYTIKPGESLKINELTFNWNDINVENQFIYLRKASSDVWFNELDNEFSGGRLAYNPSKPSSSAKQFNITLKDLSQCKALTLDKNQFTNHTKNITFIFPVGYKYDYTGVFTSYSQRTRMEARVITVIKTIVTWVESIFSWIKGLFKKEEQVEEQQTVYDTVTYVERIDENIVKYCSLSKAIEIKPGESCILPKPNQPALYNFVLLKDSVVSIKKYSKTQVASDPVLSTTPLSFKTEGIFTGELDSCVTQSDGNYHIIAQVEYSDLDQNLDYTADAKFTLISPKVSVNNIYKTGNVLNMFKKNNSIELSSMNHLYTMEFTAGNNLTISSNNDSDKKVFKLNRTLQSGNIEKFTFDNSNKSLEFEPKDLIQSESKHIGIKKQYNLKFNNSNFYDYIVNTAVDLASKFSSDLCEEYEQDVLYHINYLEVDPTVLLTFTADNTVKLSENKLADDVNFMLKYTNIGFTFADDAAATNLEDLSEKAKTAQIISISDDDKPTITNKATKTTIIKNKINDITKELILDKKSKKLNLKLLNTTESRIINPAVYSTIIKENSEIFDKIIYTYGSKNYNLDKKLRINVSKYGLYYYNGTIYKK